MLIIANQSYTNSPAPYPNKIKWLPHIGHGSREIRGDNTFKSLEGVVSPFSLSAFVINTRDMAKN